MISARVLVAMPAVAWLYTRAMMSFFALQRAEMPHGTMWTIEDGLSTTPAKRNGMVAQFLRDEAFTHLLLLDSDMIVPSDLVRRLLAHGRDVVGALYTCRFPPFTVVGGRQTTADGHGRAEGTCNYWPIAPGQGLQPADRIGGAVMLVARHVFRSVAPPWFDSPPEALDADDFYFCEKAQRAGVALWIDTDLVVGHLTVSPSTPARAPELAAVWDAMTPR